ncbi:TetR/AcrR family transcriptional regulator [Microbacterium sp.]|uniref:TetR/AcrR family transcriptional regulator n=1 Tax=Microbacterium sp. TaxID=51671 RepID=UPI003A8B283C
MPKVIDHDERRAQIVRATWRSIAARGIEATTMRQLAREMGLSNGTIVHYFPNKQSILTAAFEYVFEATNDRFTRSITAAPATGIGALRAFLWETLPIDEQRRLEARIVIPFLEFAATDEALAALFRDRMNEWFRQLTDYLTDAIAAGDARADLDVRTSAELIVSTVHGIQSVALLLPDTMTPERLVAQMEALLDSVR